MSVCSAPKRPPTGAPTDAEEIGAPQGHVHCHGAGVAPESGGNVDDTRRPLREGSTSPFNQQHPPRGLTGPRGPGQPQSAGFSVEPSTTQKRTVSPGPVRRREEPPSAPGGVSVSCLFLPSSTCFQGAVLPPPGLSEACRCVSVSSFFL